ncbi:MAG: hypothetical protein RLP45_15335, partial [Haliea sp.]
MKTPAKFPSAQPSTPIKIPGETSACQPLKPATVASVAGDRAQALETMTTSAREKCNSLAVAQVKSWSEAINDPWCKHPGQMMDTKAQDSQSIRLPGNDRQDEL